MMPVVRNLPKGCTSIRGSSNIAQVSSKPGRLVTQANRIYMLRVKQDSLVNKRNSLTARLKEIDRHLEAIEADVRETEEARRPKQENPFLKRNLSHAGEGPKKGQRSKRVKQAIGKAFKKMVFEF
jgi:hypothetical protein